MTPAPAPPIPHLLLPTPPGRPSTDRTLEHRARQGELLRLRRGVYVDTAAFFSAYPSQQHLLAAAATAAVKRRPVFCRETSLAVHGVPMLQVPNAVHLRTFRSSRAGASGASLPQLPTQHRELQHLLKQAQFSSELIRRRFQALTERRVVAPIPTGYHRAQATAAYRNRELQLPLGPPAQFFRDLLPPGQLTQAESLTFSVIDTVARMELADAVVVLDAVLGGRVPGHRALAAQDFAPWLDFLGPQRMKDRWDQLIAFADGAAESVGESWSRAVMHTLGFPAPILQANFQLPRGDTARTDFYWPDLGLVGEFDGRMKYSRSRVLSGLDPGEVVFQEKLREEALSELGLRVVRWVWDDLKSPQQLAHRLLRAGLPQTDRTGSLR